MTGCAGMWGDIVYPYASGRYFEVYCPCGFRVESLSTEEAASDTAKWHLGLPSFLGKYGPWLR